MSRQCQVLTISPSIIFSLWKTTSKMYIYFSAVPDLLLLLHQLTTQYNQHHLHQFIIVYSALWQESTVVWKWSSSSSESSPTIWSPSMFPAACWSSCPGSASGWTSTPSPPGCRWGSPRSSPCPPRPAASLPSSPRSPTPRPLMCGLELVR